jgi:hypothetical protein
LQKTDVQTLQASFATGTLSAHCGHEKGGIMKHLLFLFLVLTMVFSVYAEDKDKPPSDYKGSIAERPKFTKGDRWEYTKPVGRVVSYEFMEEINEQLIFQYQENSNKKKEIYTPDLNLVKIFNKEGELKEEFTPYKGSFRFPLFVGKKWNYAYSTTKHEKKGQPGILEDYNVDVKVVSYEQIKLPAGTFWAFKIEESKLKWGVKPKPKRVFKHRTVWYSPEVKNVVKVEEQTEAHNLELTKYAFGNAK